VLTIPHRRNVSCYKTFKKPVTRTDTLVRTNQWNWDIQSGTWKAEPVRSVSLTTAAKDLSRHKLDLVGVQEIRWNK
jgi:hypothetical protein